MDDHRHDGHGGDDHGEEQHGHACAEACAQRVGDGRLEHRRQRAHAAQQQAHQPGQQVGVVHDHENRTQNHHGHGQRKAHQHPRTVTGDHGAARPCGPRQRPNDENARADDAVDDALDGVVAQAGARQHPLHQQHDAHQRQGHAHQQDTEASVEAEPDQQPAQRGHERPHQPGDGGAHARTPRAHVRLGQVADGGHDVEPAHPARSQHHDEEGEEHAQRVGDGGRRGRHVEAEGEDAAVLADAPGDRVEEAADEADHEVGDAQPQQHAQRGRDQVVDQALGHEHLHQMAPAHADGPGHAHLAAPLGRQHDEDEEDEQHRGQNREDAEERENGREDRAAHARDGDDVGLAQRIDDVELVDPGEGIAQLGRGVRGDIQVEQPIAHGLGRQRGAQLRRDLRLVQRRGQSLHQRREVGQLHHVLDEALHEARSLKLAAECVDHVGRFGHNRGVDVGPA